MAESFDAVYENGVLRPLGPVHFVDGLSVHLTVSPPAGPLTKEQVQALLRLGQKVYEGLPDEENKDQSPEEIRELVRETHDVFGELTDEEWDEVSQSWMR